MVVNAGIALMVTLATQQVAGTQTPCDDGGNSAFEDVRWAPPAGVPLLLGVTSGMRESEARELLRRPGRQRLSFVPDVSFEAFPDVFSNRTRGVVLRTGYGLERVQQALIDRVGAPVVHLRGFRSLGQNGDGGARLVTMKWCEGPLSVVLRGSERAYALHIGVRRAGP